VDNVAFLFFHDVLLLFVLVVFYWLRSLVRGRRKEKEQLLGAGGKDFPREYRRGH